MLSLLAALSGWKAVRDASWGWTLAAVIASSLAIQFKMSAIGLAVFPIFALITVTSGWPRRLVFCHDCDVGRVD